jgi:hypothetical protein
MLSYRALPPVTLGMDEFDDLLDHARAAQTAPEPRPAASPSPRPRHRLGGVPDPGHPGRPE